MAENGTEVFRTDLKQIFEFIRYAKDKKRLKELVQSDSAYQDMDEEAYDMVVVYMGAEKLEEDIDIIHRICDVAEEVIPRYDVEKIYEKIL